MHTCAQCPWLGEMDLDRNKKQCAKCVLLDERENMLAEISQVIYRQLTFDDAIIDIYDDVVINYAIDRVAKRLGITANPAVRAYTIKRIRDHFEEGNVDE
jgi:hypothetical protein